VSLGKARVNPGNDSDMPGEFCRRGCYLVVRWLCFLFFAAAAGCSKPYSSPVVSVVLPTNGATQFDGLLSLATPDEKIIWTHGVCPTDYKWVENRAALVQASLGPSASVTDGPSKRDWRYRRPTL
jgi:hypothetical protein